MDVYRLKLNETFLFDSYDNFTSELGIPQKITTREKEFIIVSKAAADDALRTVKDGEIATLYYSGFEMWYTSGKSIVPFTIDLRKSEKKINYGEITFDRDYTEAQFGMKFPKSVLNPVGQELSLFGIITKEQNPDVKSYMVMRRSKDDPTATPTVEFTFWNEKLIFIVFANF